MRECIPLHLSSFPRTPGATGKDCGPETQQRIGSLHVSQVWLTLKGPGALPGTAAPTRRTLMQNTANLAASHRARTIQ